MGDRKYTLSELRQVQGIGEKTIKRIKDKFNSADKSHVEYCPEKHIEPNILVEGDVLDRIRGVKSNSIDMIATDPPYKTTTRGNSGGTGGLLKNDDSLGGKMFKHNELDFDDWLPHMYRVLKENGHAYFMTNNKNLKKMMTSVESAGFKIYKVLVWVKNTPITNMWYMDSHEYIIFARKGRAVKINNCGTKSVLFFDNPKEKTHPTEKPVDLMRILVENSSKKDDVVLDPFMGSGATGIACVKTNRKFIGIELDKEYFEIAKKRIEKANQKKKGL